MKKLNSVISGIVLITMLFTMSLTNVFAAEDDATLSEMDVFATNSSYNRVDLMTEFSFSADNTDCQITATHDTAYIYVSATAASEDDGATVEIPGEASTSVSGYYYFSVSEGENTEEIIVTAANGDTVTYNLTITVLTEEEEAEYEERRSVEASDLKVTKIDGEVMYVSTYIPSDVETPKGFEKGTSVHDDIEYEVFINDTKGMTVYYLFSNEELTEGGLYVANEDEDADEQFYKLQNIKVKSRMYTIVSPDAAELYEEDKDYLEDFTETEITIDGETVTAWQIEDDGDFYLLYAVNWNGEENLYCYDAGENCLQRYDINSSTIQQLEAAGDSYTELQGKYNELVSKYNTNNSNKWKIIAALGVFCVILIFVMINLILRIKSAKYAEEREYEYDGADNNDDMAPGGGYVELSFDTDDEEKETDLELVSVDDEEDSVPEEKNKKSKKDKDAEKNKTAEKSGKTAEKNVTPEEKTDKELKASDKTVKKENADKEADSKSQNSGGNDSRTIEKAENKDVKDEEAAAKEEFSMADDDFEMAAKEQSKAESEPETAENDDDDFEFID